MHSIGIKLWSIWPIVHFHKKKGKKYNNTNNLHTKTIQNEISTGIPFSILIFNSFKGSSHSRLIRNKTKYHWISTIAIEILNVKSIKLSFTKRRTRSLNNVFVELSFERLKTISFWLMNFWMFIDISLYIIVVSVLNIPRENYVQYII